jgi:retron-type reverse transcriptase
MHKIYGFRQLSEASRKVALGKANNATAMRWKSDEIRRICELQEKLKSGTWKIVGYNSFKVYYPKERNVMAINHEAKVVLHSLCDNVLYPEITRRFIRDNCAVQVGKGTHDALNRLTKHLRHYYMSRRTKLIKETDGWPDDYSECAQGWVLKGDFSKYFYTLRHDYCKYAMAQAVDHLKDEDLKWFTIDLTNYIIDSTPGPGLPIGNQTSQLLALLYLDWFDHWLKDELGLVYGRYMDDFYIIHEDKEFLRALLAEIKKRIADYGLSLNNKTQLFPIRNGIDYLGFHLYLTDTGKVVKKIKAKSADNTRRRIVKFRRLYNEQRITLEGVFQSYMSWRGHAACGDTYHMLQKMDAHFLKHFPMLEEKLKGKKVDNDETTFKPSGRLKNKARHNLRRKHQLDCSRPQPKRNA